MYPALVDTTEARSSRARIQDTADRIAQQIVPIVLGVASIAFLVWTLVLTYARHECSGEAVADGLSYAVAVLALSYPCALTLCVPLVILYARIASQKPPFSLLFRSSAALQHARIVTHVIFDKTGTLTIGKMRVAEAVFCEDNDIWITGVAEGLIKALVTGSEHPVSAAVARYLPAQSALVEELDDVETIVGGRHSSQLKWFYRSWRKRWLSVFAITVDRVLLTAFELEDNIRPESTEVVSSLVARGISVSMLNGDHQKAFWSAFIRGLPPSERSPAHKRSVLTAMQAGLTIIHHFGDYCVARTEMQEFVDIFDWLEDVFDICSQGSAAESYYATGHDPRKQ
ncbi:uncharacterized protein BT62DRAFT_1051387 [Guyanagaster necrorhizus]|uniref:Uncharacterized protein n=1 Tax=Guyanagaster necrorhizus TaxID=856835 RepID=A0A9P8AMT2_9AGAR|nr:uncharacterized protein BT62DRAFT_1051387 [Guyanagaster necrorhizus MCA 3950]KAG7440152.1 hypothetical protein BT62DRAFT_1051387 [Guyanagaster necrorhizus MCA 3950]